MDDKTYNKETLNELDSTLKNLNVSKDSFYYIADSALFSEDNLTIAEGKEIKLITRIPDNVLVAKNSIEEAVDQLERTYPTFIYGLWILKDFSQEKFLCSIVIIF